MVELRGITVAVGEWYARTLSITLPRNARHFGEVLVVTSPNDDDVRRVVASVPNARVFATDAFTRHGAAFNKGLAMEEGFSELGRHGVICIHDADILFPATLPLERIVPGRLYGMRRRILTDPAKWSDSLDWRLCPMHRDGGPIGFAQVFHAADIAAVHPWYDVTFAHGGGGDAFFMGHWPREKWCVLPVDVLHLGPPDRHWFGTSPEAVDTMAAFVVRNGWTRAALQHDRAADARVGEIRERVEVPGYPPSTFELPFVKRAQQRQKSAP